MAEAFQSGLIFKHLTTNERLELTDNKQGKIATPLSRERGTMEHAQSGPVSLISLLVRQNLKSI